MLTKNINKTLRVAVVGNPNSGKSTLINAIAGSRLKVGNWPGVTVEKKEASFKHNNINIKLIDLPGIYSLSPYSEEEIIARNFLIKRECDLIVNVIDSTNIQRNLYLTTQLTELEVPMIIAFNIGDEAFKRGISIDQNTLDELLKVRSVITIATKKEGINELLDKIVTTNLDHKPKDLNYSNDIKRIIDFLDKEYGSLIRTSNLPQKWLITKIIEGDLNFPDSEKFKKINIKPQLEELKKNYDSTDLETFIAEQRYAIANGIAQQIITTTEVNKINISKAIDKIILNRFLAIPLFLLTMWVIFKLTFDIATPFIDWTDALFVDTLRKWGGISLASIGASNWMISLVTDGIISGVGFVLVFTPIIFTMMFFITFLESSGYMSRAAFITDRLMRSFGLHGKSFIPMLIGFGCNVPAIYATRTLESKKDRIITCLAIPFMSCGARLPVYVLFTSVFFTTNAATVIWILYILGILLAGLVSIILQKKYFKQEPPLFVMELPPYRLPTLKSLMIHTWEKGKHFIKKAGTYIFAVSIVVWLLLNMPWGVENKQDSYLGKLGTTISPIFKPIGFGNWEASSSLITGIIAKEIIIGTMGEIYVNDAPTNDLTKKENHSFSQDIKYAGLSMIDAFIEAKDNILSTFKISSLSAELDEENNGLRKVIQSKFTPLSAFVFMVFTLLYMPCVVTGIAMKQEFGTWKWFFIATAIGLTSAWTLSFIIYQIGLFFI